MEVGNDTGIQPDYLRKKGNKKRQIPAMGNWRTKNSHYYAESHGTIMPMQCYTCPEKEQCFFLTDVDHVSFEKANETRQNNLQSATVSLQVVMMDSYKGTLESIKKGVLYSKDSGDGDTYSMIPPTEDVVSSYSVDVTKDNGKTVHIGDYSTVEELDKAISDAVKNGQLTQEEADSVQQ